MNLTKLQLPVLEDVSFETPGARHEVCLEPTAKRIRAFLGDMAVADSCRAMLMLETGRLPVYYFPVEDVHTHLLLPGNRFETSAYKGQATYMHIQAGDRRAENAAWRYGASPAGCPDLARYVAFHWKLMDAWYEEDEEVFFHARDPHHRIDVLHSSRHVQVRLGDVVLADTWRSRMLFETGLPARYYIRREDVRLDLLSASDTMTACPYKGQTSGYWAASVDGASLDAAWSYGHPLPEVGKIAELVCFFNERVDIAVDGIPQPKPRSPWS